MTGMISVKCVVVGSGLSAKTELLHAYISQQSTANPVGKDFDNYFSPMMIGNSPVTMGLFNTAGQEDYDRLRSLSYPQTDVFLLCFSIMSPSSFDELEKRFIPEVKLHCPDVPIILVGTECHLKKDPKSIREFLLSGKTPVERKKVAKLVNEIKAVKYIECSSSTKKGVDLVFEEAAIAAIDYSVGCKDKEGCSIT